MRSGRFAAVAGGILLTLLTGAGPARAATGTAPALDVDAQAAAQTATQQGYRTGVAVLDLQTGAYAGAGEDTAEFASESVVKVMIAAQLLLGGQMTGDVETRAYEMITRSDDDDANALYDLAGGDDVLTDLAAHYGIASLGEPPDQPGYWGSTKITAAGIVHLYAALASDPVVGPWLTDAMSHPSAYGADGTYQLFGLPAAVDGAAVKQGWGDDGDDSPDAVFNSTGYVGGGRYAVAILTDGPPGSYGATISGVVTAQAKALLPVGALPVAAAPSAAGATRAAPTAGPAPAAPEPAAPAPAASGPAPSSSRLRHALALAGVDLAGGITLLSVLVLPWRRRSRLLQPPRRP